MDRKLFGEIRSLLRPLERKLKLVASKAVLELIKDSAGLQQVQVSLLAGESSDGSVEHMQPGGLTHVPLSGAEGVYLTIGGVRDDGVVLALSNRAKRPKGLAGGETCLYSSGAQPITLLLKADGTLEITAPLKASLKAPAIEWSASGTPTQAFLGGTAAVAALNTLFAALGTYIAALGTGVPATPLTAGIAATAATPLATAIGVAEAALTGALSAVIKGE